MNCVDSSTKTTTTKLLTQADKIAKLEKVFSKHRSKSDVFLPDESFYATNPGIDEVQRMADTLFTWLGIKHRSLEFHIDPEQVQLVHYSKQGSAARVTLGWQCLKDSFLCGGAVAHAIAHHLLIGRAKLCMDTNAENEELTDLATIYIGFSVVVMNSLDNKQSGALGSMARVNYISECIDYFQERSVVTNIWQPYVMPKLIRKFVSNILPSSHYAPYIQSKLQQKSRNKNKLFLASSLLVALIGVTALILSYQPKNLSAKMQAQQDDITLIKSQYKQCIDTVARKQQTWNQNDIFIQRQIEADQSRCTSLRNQYNYQANKYNSKL